MCGICGKFSFTPGETIDRHLVKSMADAIHHRGPDDEGFYISGQIGLGFRRLSIIDLSGGHQPLSNENGTIWIVFNGEIYNYQELRKDLLAKGHIFSTNSDTEVIVHLYEEYGRECVKKLRGMFGFAIWDGVKKSLFLARDRVGIKPLYYYLGGKFISFGSEIKAILADPAVKREVDPQSIDRFLTYLYIPGNTTLFHNLFKLEPGHTLTVEANGERRFEQYWDLDFSRSRFFHSEEDAQQELLELLEETVQLHMISDVPVGFLLSGGVDSTAMLSLAKNKTDKPISTFTLGFSSASVVDERPYARLAAEKFGSKHYELTISPNEFLSFLPSYVWYMEEPICQPPAINLYYISKLASEYVKVLISGEGGDEAFAGYENYRNNFWFEQTKRFLGPMKSPIASGMTALGNKFHSRVFSRYGPRFAMPLEEYYLSRTSSPDAFFNRDIHAFYSREMADVINKQESLAVAHRYHAAAANFGVLEKMLYLDSKTWLPDDLLVKADKMTMANSVELRVPFLDHKVLEFAAQLPRNYKVRGLKMKYLAKKALRTRVPEEILKRKKAGFPVPYETWFRQDLNHWVRDLLLDSRTKQRGYFQSDVVEKMIEQNQAGHWNSQNIFSLVVLELWHRTFVDQPVSQPASVLA